MGWNLVLFVLLPNVFFYFLGLKYYIMRPVFNVDYLILGLFEPFLPGVLFFLLLFLLFANDLAINLAAIYHFDVANMFSSLKDLSYLDYRYTMPKILTLVVFSAALTGLVTWLRRYIRPWGLMRAVLTALLAVFICAVDILNGTSFLHFGDGVSFANINFANSAIRKSGMSAYDAYIFGDDMLYSPVPAGQSATSQLFERLNAKSSVKWPRIVLINIESLGVIKDTVLSERVLSPLFSSAVSSRYAVERGNVPFQGPTIYGEFRELCDVRILKRGLQKTPTTCLPALLKNAGYRTEALHGFTDMFYGRNAWYPQIGFESVLFAEQLQSLGMRRKCGSAVRGLCDEDIAEYLRAQLKGSIDTKKFVYWMTLNTHLPLDAQSVAGSTFDCQQDKATRESKQMCYFAQAMNNLLKKVADVVTDPDILPSYIVLVGDHSPPFQSTERRSAFSPDHVPYFILTPKDPLRVTHIGP